jgi:hypothetical protein
MQEIIGKRMIRLFAESYCSLLMPVQIGNLAYDYSKFVKTFGVYTSDLEALCQTNSTKP